MKLNIITHLIIDEDDSDWDGRGRFFPGSWDGDRHASTPTGDGSPRSPLGVFTRSAVSRDVAAEHVKDSSHSHIHRRYSEDHGERRIDKSRSRNADKVKMKVKMKVKEKEKNKNEEKEKNKEKKHRLKDSKGRERNRSLSRDREDKGGGGGGGSGDDFQSAPPRQQQSVYIAVQQVPYLTLPHLTLPYPTLPYLTLPYLTLPHLTLPYLTSQRHMTLQCDYICTAGGTEPYQNPHLTGAVTASMSSIYKVTLHSFIASSLLSYPFITSPIPLPISFLILILIVTQRITAFPSAFLPPLSSPLPSLTPTPSPLTLSPHTSSWPFPIKISH